MFKNQEQIVTFVDKIEKFITSSMHYTMFRNQGLDESAKRMATVLNQKRTELEEFIAAVCNITPANDTVDDYKCPDCGSDMRLRTNRSNGDKFWGCVKYPNCRGTRDENGLSKAEREEAKYRKEQVAQEGGFSFNRDKRNPVTEVSPPVDTGWINPFAKK